ncbi:hypothetical protein QJS10_CPA16g00942 [Acorus calamus]|uniref:Uncharacterized protein n=1 Tax=Acorus calamus TaxID=4465 RepID=A0AAV9D040_ACOCL|nr:hypothetical protein QJS10_CPA16g00942 [Acorus calamus]
MTKFIDFFVVVDFFSIDVNVSDLIEPCQYHADRFVCNSTSSIYQRISRVLDMGRPFINGEDRQVETRIGANNHLG